MASSASLIFLIIYDVSTWKEYDHLPDSPFFFCRLHGTTSSYHLSLLSLQPNSLRCSMNILQRAERKKNKINMYHNFSCPIFPMYCSRLLFYSRVIFVKFLYRTLFRFLFFDFASKKHTVGVYPQNMCQQKIKTKD